jgi:O-methyltransferase
MKLAYSAREFAKRIAFRSRALNWLSRPTYGYNLKPAQLAALIDALDGTKHLHGAVVEIGVARGMTTFFLNRHMNEAGDARRFICVDTFSGFLPGDVAYERDHRGKNDPTLKGFAYNDLDIFRRNVAEFSRVEVIQKDCSLLTPAELGPVSVALLDVDLYLPTKRAIGTIYDALERGGIVMVDDVTANSVYDGAAQAYFEFCKERDIRPRVIADKGGMLQK